MSDTEPPPTSRVCPACGYSGGLLGCKICDGSGLATPQQIARWQATQRTGATSTATKSIPFQIEEAIRGLEDRRTAQTAPLIPIGRRHLAAIQANPTDARTLELVSSWLTSVQSLLRGER